MSSPCDIARLGSQESKQVVCGLALFHFPHTSPPAILDAAAAELRRRPPAAPRAGHAVAAPRGSGEAGPTGFDVVNAAARRLRDRPAAAAELRRMVLTRHRFDFEAFGADARR